MSLTSLERMDLFGIMWRYIYHPSTTGHYYLAQEQHAVRNITTSAFQKVASKSKPYNWERSKHISSISNTMSNYLISLPPLHFPSYSQIIPLLNTNILPIAST